MAGRIEVLTLDSPDKIVRYLVQSPLLRGIDEEVLRLLDPAPEAIVVRAGETLVRQGDRNTDYFLLVRGRLRIFERTDEDEVIQTGHVLPGEGIGEESLFTGAPSAVTVIARLDSELIKFPQATFMVLAACRPMAALTIAATVIDRARKQPSVRRVVKFPAIAVAGLEPALDPVTLAHELAQALELHGRSMVVQSDFAGDHDELLKTIDFAVYACGPDSGDWTRFCIAHADLVLFAVSATGNAEMSDIERDIVARLDRMVLGRADLLLVHDDGWKAHGGAARWIDRLRPHEFHHVRARIRTDFARLARILAGRANNVVLSGGGARSFAQIGVLRALHEFGIPADRLGGTSMGAAIAALGALAEGFEDGVRRMRELFRRRRPARDYTLPLLSLLAGKRMTSIGMDLFGETRIEDLPLRYFCVSSDLGNGEVIEHFEGMLWMAVRATAAMPVVAPPFARDGRILVDGGVLNNLPVDVMMDHFSGRLIAVDTSEQKSLIVDSSWNLTCPSGFDILRRKLNPFAPPANLPNILEVLRRTATLASERLAHRARRNADLLIVPPVATFGFTDFDRFDAIVEEGYRHAVRQLEQSTRQPE